MMDIVQKFTEAATDFLSNFKPGAEPMNAKVEACPDGKCNPASEDKLISELQRIYNPVLVSQELNKQTSDVVLESVTADNIFTENNVIKFDDDTRKAQLISLCSLLLARDANSPDYLAYKQAAKAKHAMKLKIQEDYNAAAVDLADRYLQSVAATSNSPIAKDAAENLKNAQ